MWLEIAWSLVALVLLLALVLPVVPVDLVADASGDAVRGASRLRLRVEWLFGLVRKDLRRGTHEGRSAPREKKRRFDVVAMLRAEGFLPAMGRMLRRWMRALRVRDFAARLRVGTGDPADTGRLVGALWPFLAVSSALSPGAIALEPAWAEVALEGSLRGRLRVTPYRVLLALLLFLGTRGAWRGLRAARRRPS